LKISFGGLQFCFQFSEIAAGHFGSGWAWLVRDKDGTVYVLEDNLRVPSGVSYMIENRQVVKRVLPELFEDSAILPVDDYPSQLHEMLVALSPRRTALFGKSVTSMQVRSIEM